LALFKTLMEKETGLEWIEVVIRYIVSARDEEDLSAKELVEIAEQAISKETGEYVMTLLEKLRKEGEERGKQEGKQEGFKEAIEMGITFKFPGDIEAVMAEVNKIDDPETLKEITKTIYTANDISEILALLK
jgi:flagellar biosynthesis/type III secretory pathway protein FliH